MPVPMTEVENEAVTKTLTGFISLADFYKRVGRMDDAVTTLSSAIRVAKGMVDLFGYKPSATIQDMVDILTGKTQPNPNPTKPS